MEIKEWKYGGRDANGDVIKIPFTEEEKRQNEGMSLAMKLAHDNAKENGLGRDKGGTGSIPCPNCKTGILSYSVSEFNGHMWAVCSTKNCCAWME